MSSRASGVTPFQIAIRPSPIRLMLVSVGRCAWVDSLFADAEVPEDGVEKVFDADLSGDAAEGAQRQAQILGAELRQVGVGGAGEAGGGLLQGGAMAGTSE